MAEQKQQSSVDASILEKIHLNVVTPHIGVEYFESKEYLDIIPLNDQEWVFGDLDIKSDEYTSSNLDHFVPPDYDPDHNNVGHPYMNDVMSGLQIFKQWRNLPHSKDKSDQNAWKFLKEVEKLKIFWTHIPNEVISAIKAEMIVPYSVPIIAGCIINDKHLCHYNPNLQYQQQLQNLNAYKLIIICLYLFIC